MAKRWRGESTNAGADMGEQTVVGRGLDKVHHTTICARFSARYRARSHLRDLHDLEQQTAAQPRDAMALAPLSWLTSAKTSVVSGRRPETGGRDA